jgi:hypothetical protein
MGRLAREIAFDGQFFAWNSDVDIRWLTRTYPSRSFWRLFSHPNH